MAQRWLAIVLVSMAAVPGVFPQQQQTEPPKQPEPAKIQEASPTLPSEALPASVDPRTYRIGPEDILKVLVWKEPELSGFVGVRPDGMITANLIGDVKVADLTPEEVNAMLREKFGEFVINPIVQVSVASVRSKKYYVNGNVNRPGQYPLVVDTSVFEALSLAGGLTEFANKKKIVIMRGSERLYFNYNEVKKGRKLEQNIKLRNGDFIIVD